MSVTLSPSVDAFVDQGRPTTNFGDAPQLRLGQIGGDNNRGFIFHGLPFPRGATIHAARLRLRATTNWTGQNLVVRRVVQSWQRGRVNWSNQPNTVETHLVSVPITASAGDVIEITGLEGMLQAAANGGNWFGYRLNASGSNDRRIASSNHPTARFRPEVIIEWSEEPEAPVRLVPGGEQAVSVSHPVLSWQFSPRGDLVNQEQTESHVQIAETNDEDFTSPIYDSGFESNEEPSWDLSDTAFAGLDNDDEVLWRVRVKDDQGLESGWSDPAEFTRKTHGTLEITQPPSTVEETSPPITWNLTGRTQESFRVILFRIRGDGEPIEVWRVPWNTSEDTTVTVPSQGQIITGPTYRVQVDVRDDIDRVATPGDLDFVRETQEFTYERSGAPAEVETLTAVPQQAKVVLTWTRTAQPDYFSLRVDGEERDTRIEPADVHVSGSTYSMDWWGARPGVEHTYEVEAVVHDLGVLKHSDGNATDTAKTNPDSIWLVDPSDGLHIRLLGQESADLAIREVGATFDVLGSRRPVRITDAVMGYSGRVSGQVFGEPQRDAFLELKGRLKPLRLILSDLNIRVVLEDSTAAPTPTPGEKLYEISFDCFQFDAQRSFEIAGG